MVHARDRLLGLISVAFVAAGMAGPRGITAQSAEGTRPAQGSAVQLGADIQFPPFDDYPATDSFCGSPAPVRIDTAAYGRTFRTRLRAGARKGPNFAGRFTVVQWGCGSSCQIVSVVDAKTGRLSQQTLRTANGVAYRANSRLIIADPIQFGDPPLDQCASCGTPAAYVWNGEQFQPIGSGPHPHLSGDRPW